MANIHYILQGKGGVGKSLVASLVAQLCQSKGSIECYDTDPTNATFSGYKALGVKRVDIMEDEDINQRNFDQLMEAIANSNAENIIIDNGASTFIPLASYLNSNKVIDILNDLGHTVYIHTVITAGQGMRDTLTGFDALAKKFGQQSKLVVWLNLFWGKVAVDGKSFIDMKVYKENESLVDSIVVIPEYKKETFSRDLSEMLTDRMTFDERIESKTVQFMEKQRLKSMRDELFENMAVIFEHEAAQDVATTEA